MKYTLHVGLLLSVIINLMLVYRIFDLGVTSTYQMAEFSYKSDQLATVEKIFPFLVPEISRHDLLEKAKKTGLTVFEKDDAIYVDTVGFVLSEDQVKAIKF